MKKLATTSFSAVQHIKDMSQIHVLSGMFQAAANVPSYPNQGIGLY